MPEYMQILQEQYRTEYLGPWHTREYYPWEYEAKARELSEWKPSFFVTEDDCKWSLQQARILRDRASYIRQKWARQEASRIFKEAMTPVTQQATSPIPKEQVTQPAISPEQAAKKKHRNEKTRQQYKRRILQRANTEQIAEKTAEKATITNSSTVNTSLLPTVSYEAVKQSDRERASRHNSSKLQNSFRLRFLATKHYHYAWLASPPGYMEYAKRLEATGQG